MNPLCKPSGKTACQPLLIGSHVGMSGTSMMDGSVQEALSYGANTFMLYTGAPQNTRRKPVDELCIPQAQERMRQNNITRFVVHAPYIINLANTVKPEVFSLAVEFLAKEIERTEAMGSDVLILASRFPRRRRNGCWNPSDHRRLKRSAFPAFSGPHRTGNNGRQRLRNRQTL